MSALDRLIQRLAGGKREQKDVGVEVLVLDPQEGPVYAVGDVHGCLRLYREIETHILRDAEAFNGTPTIVLLGDFIDRGPQSAAVIDHLLGPPPVPARRLCLLGNHEAMMLDYLASPKGKTEWLNLGGHETLMSYGLMADLTTLHRMTERKLLQTLAAHLPERHTQFLRGLLPGLRVDTYLLAHAGSDATAPLTAQPREALVWGKAGLAAPEGLTLVHGHYVTPLPRRSAHSIGIDTGAYATGRLTALRLVPGQAPAAVSTIELGPFKELPTHE